MGSKGKKGYVFTNKLNGHRESYQNLFCKITKFDPITCEDQPRLTIKLISTNKLIIACLEDNIIYHLWLIFIRTLLFKKTVAIAMNPARSFNGGLFKHKLQSLLMKALKLNPFVKTLTILPFYLDSRLSKLADDWIYDPQFWDLNLEEISKINTDLADEILAKAKGRKILLFLGKANQIKGFDRLVEVMEQDLTLGKKLFILAAGNHTGATKGLLERFADVGGNIVNRFLSEDEVTSLKYNSDIIWALYDPYYNSSSGLFGRAMQLGKDVFVRKDSYIANMALNLDYPVQAVEFNDTNRMVHLLNILADSNVSNADDDLKQNYKFEHNKNLSVAKILKALE